MTNVQKAIRYFEGLSVAVALKKNRARYRYSTTFLFMQTAFATQPPFRESASSGVVE